MKSTLRETRLNTRIANSTWLRGLLLTLLLAAYARLLWRLGAENLWWDESLSLQRAESSLWPLLQGIIIIRDGLTEMRTTDQHPFFFFLLEGLMVRAVGTSEFALRYLSVMAATLLVPAAWTFSQLFVRQRILPSSAPVWSALLAAVSPFYLWYGQEARPYALWALLALLSSYLLLRASQQESLRTRWLAGFVLCEICFLTTHYFALFLLPLHAAIILLWLGRYSWRMAWAGAAGLLLAGGLSGGWIGWSILERGGGINFRWVPLHILFVDLLNAFSLGPATEPIGVWWLLDLLYAGVALLGALYALRNWAALQRGGWIASAMIAVPLLVLIIVNLVQPAYMNARHMSLIGGGYLLLAGGGLAVIWHGRRFVAVVILLLMLMGVGRSSLRYFTMEEYAKDDYASLGSFFDRRILPGDAVLFNPPFSWRIFYHYLDLESVESAQAAGANVAISGVPLLGRSWDETFAYLETLRSQYRRLWLITSGTHPYLDLDGQTEQWLLANMYLVQQVTFFSHSTLNAQLYTPLPPVFNEPIPIDGYEIDVFFGDQIRLIGYQLAPPLATDTPLPVTLYWQTARQTDRHYKYILRAVSTTAEKQGTSLTVTEREPYDGALPTIYWAPGQTIVEYSDLQPVPGHNLYSELTAQQAILEVEVYDAETLQKLPVSHAAGAGVSAREQVVQLVVPNNLVGER